jgi:transposase-like protein
MAKQYSPRLKLQITMEVLRDNKKPSQVAKAYGVHPNSVKSGRRPSWKRDRSCSPKTGPWPSTSAALRSWNVCRARRRWRSRF